MSAMTMSDLVQVAPRNVPVPAVPHSRGQWCRWAEVQIEDGSDWGRETELLRVLAGGVDDRGVRKAGVALLARKVRRSESTVKAWLAALRERGVLRTTQRGRGSVAEHHLVAELVEQQLSLFQDVGREQEGDAPAEPLVGVPAAAASPLAAAAGPDRATASSQPESRVKPAEDLAPAVTEAVTEETAVCEGAPARDDERPVTSPSLPAVLAVLAEAEGGLNTEDGPVDSALRRFPEGPASPVDHLRAAGFVVTQALEPDCRVRAAGVLLHRELERQVRAAASDPSCLPGRRRPASPAPVVTTRSPAGRRWVVTDNKYDRAAGLC